MLKILFLIRINLNVTMQNLKNYIHIRKKNSIIQATDDTIRTIIDEEVKRFGPNGDYNYIDVSRCTNMEKIFYTWERDFLREFNGDISKWDVSNVTTMSFMFGGCFEFNCDLNEWDVSNVTDMTGTFSNCKTFNKPLDKWDVRNVVKMQATFTGAEKFNQDISNWQPISCTNMKWMFAACKKFCQDLSQWPVENVTTYSGMFNEGPMSKYQNKNLWPKFKS